jgi:lipoprotein signal peptidase
MIAVIVIAVIMIAVIVIAVIVIAVIWLLSLWLLSLPYADLRNTDESIFRGILVIVMQNSGAYWPIASNSAGLTVSVLAISTCKQQGMFLLLV